MAQILSPGGVKPTQWRFNPALVEPRWRGLAGSLKHLIPIFSAGPVRDLVTGTYLTLATGNDVDAVGPGGREKFLEFDAWSMTIPASHRITDFPVTVAALFAVDGDEPQSAVLDLADSGSTSRNINVLAGNNDRTPGYVMRNGNFSPQFSEAGQTPIGQRQLVVAVYRSQTDAELFVDGVSVDTHNFNEAIFTPDRLTVGRFGDSTPSNVCSGVWFGVGYIWNEALTASENRALAADPFGPFRPARRRRVFVAAAAPAGPAMAGGVPTHQHVELPTRNVTVFL